MLTTSYTDAEALAARVDGLEAHRRGTKLDGYIGAFRENPEAALVTPAGWAGLNLPGLVKHLVVARLPFARPIRWRTICCGRCSPRGEWAGGRSTAF